MFWSIWETLSLVNIGVAMIFFIWWIIMISKDSDDDSKVFGFVTKNVLISILALLFTLVPCVIHENIVNEENNKEVIYHIELQNDSITVTDENGDKAIFLLGED